MLCSYSRFRITHLIGYKHPDACENPAGDLHMKGIGMLVLSLRGIYFGFWCPLGCSGENAIICSPYIAVKISFMVSREEIQPCISSFLGVKKSWVTPWLGSITSRCSGKESSLLPRKHGRVDQTRESATEIECTPCLVSFSGLIQNFRRA